MGSSSRAEGNVQWLRGPRFLPLWPGDGGPPPSTNPVQVFPSAPPHRVFPASAILQHPSWPGPCLPFHAPQDLASLSSLSRTPMLAALSPRLQEQPELGALTSRA
ncbi:unnamed protein product [Caretta caretta]